RVARGPRWRVRAASRAVARALRGAVAAPRGGDRACGIVATPGEVGLHGRGPSTARGHERPARSASLRGAARLCCTTAPAPRRGLVRRHARPPRPGRWRRAVALGREDRVGTWTGLGRSLLRGNGTRLSGPGLRTPIGRLPARARPALR